MSVVGTELKQSGIGLCGKYFLLLSCLSSVLEGWEPTPRLCVVGKDFISEVQPQPLLYFILLYFLK